MNEIVLDGGNVLAFRDTPWDAAIFGFGTNELLSLTWGDEASAGALLDAYDEHNRSHGVCFVYTRINAQDMALKKALQDRGFYFAETTCKIYLTISPRTDFDAILKGGLEIDLPGTEELEQIKAIARSNFRYGRFVEDPYLPPEAASRRYSVWVEDLVRQGAEMLVYRKGGRVRSFMIYKRDGTKAELLLGGSEKDLGYLTPSFWSSVLTHLQGAGVRQVDTTISAANVVIFNIYLLFGFKLRATLFGFHKFYPALP